MTVAIRPIERSNLAALAQIHAACFPDEAWDSSALATVLSMPATGGHIACDETGAICGFLIEQCLGDIAEILTLGVAPDLRRRGIARALLGDCLDRVTARGAVRVVLEVAADNPAGLALYQSFGFERQGKRKDYYRRSGGPSVDAWRLSLAITRRDSP